MVNSLQAPPLPPELPQASQPSSVYQNPRSEGVSIIDSDDSQTPGLVLLRGIIGGTGIDIIQLSDDIIINSTGGGGGGSGDTGPQGPTGPSGGPQGDTGAQGLQGDTGAQGSVGPQGDTGPLGETGAQGNAGPQGTQGPQGVQGSVGNFAVSYTAFVDAVYGNDGTAIISTISSTTPRPFLTLAAAISTANGIATSSNPVCINISPGQYLLTSDITIPSYVTIKGCSPNTTTLVRTPSGETNTITMSDYSRLENLTLLCDYDGVPNFGRCIVFPNNTSNTATLRTLVINIYTTSSTAQISGLYITGTNSAVEEHTTIRASTISITGNTSGTVRCVHFTSGAHCHIRDTVLYCNNLGAGIPTGILLENASDDCTCFSSSINATGPIVGVGQDVHVFSGGRLYLNGTALINATAGDKFFEGVNRTLMWSGLGTIVGSNNTFQVAYSGGTNTGNPFPYTITEPTVVKNLNITFGDGGAAGRTYVFTIKKNNVATPITATISSGGTTAVDSTNSVSYAIGDYISLEVVSSGSGTPFASDYTISVDLY